jgi:glycosyltransferase involved in cell wall biosynthesis
MKRVLIICYYWPPAGGPGVQRWLKFVKYFRDFGIEPVMYIPKNAHYPIRDESLKKEVPEQLEILRKSIKEPYKYAQLIFKKKTQTISSGIIDERDPSTLEKLMLYARGNLFIPDARVGWVNSSVKFLKGYLSENNDIDTLITTGPPHSLHLIGMQIQKEMAIKWIADFRDPWTSIHYHRSLRLSNFAKKKHKVYERQVLQAADAIVVTSPGTQREFQELTTKPIHLITNGFDSAEGINTTLDIKFTVVHIGSLLSNRNPVILWKVLAEMIQEDPEFQKDLEIKLVGLVAHEIKESIINEGLQGNLCTIGYVVHDEALRLQHASQVLLLIEMDRPETKAILPGKLFEYLQSKRPILALGPEGSDIELILKETQSGLFFNYTERQGLKRRIKELYRAYKEGAPITAQGAVDAYSRKELTSKMAALLKSL